MNGPAGFDFQALNRKYISAPSNDAAGYGVSIAKVKTMTAWVCIGAYHLTKEENGGRHNIFLELLDEHGNRVRDAAIRWTVSLDAQPQTKRPDKPDNEPAADIPLNSQDTVTVSVSDAMVPYSDSVGNLHFRHTNGGDWGHHSFYLVWQRFGAMMPPIDPPIIIDPDPPTVPLTLESLAAQVAELKRRLDAMGGE